MSAIELIALLLPFAFLASLLLRVRPPAASRRPPCAVRRRPASEATGKAGKEVRDA